MPGCDPDLVRPLEKRIRARYEQILLSTKVTGVEAQPNGTARQLRGRARRQQPQPYDRVLVAVGRSPNGKRASAPKRPA